MAVGTQGQRGAVQCRSSQRKNKAKKKGVKKAKSEKNEEKKKKFKKVCTDGRMKGTLNIHGVVAKQWKRKNNRLCAETMRRPSQPFTVRSFSLAQQVWMHPSGKKECEQLEAEGDGYDSHAADDETKDEGDEGTAAG